MKLYTKRQYDLLVVDRPDRQRRVRPEAPLVDELRKVFTSSSDRSIWQVAVRLSKAVGVELAMAGLAKMVDTYGWASFIRLKKVDIMSQVTRIVQAAAMCDTPREPVEIAVELGRRQKYIDDTQQELALFFQEVHTAHPAMRTQIKGAMNIVMRAAFQSVPGDPVKAMPLVSQAVAIARKDERRLNNIRLNSRVPKETANWLVQIIAFLTKEMNDQ